MKKYTYILLLAGLSLTTVSCKKFLNIVPTDNLSGNNFWKTKKDVELFTNGLYANLRNKVGQTGGFFPVADMRCAPIKSSQTYISQITNNDLKGLKSSNQQWTSGFNFNNNTTWKGFFDIISAANILYQEVDKVPDAALSDTDRKRYKAEAVFMRNLCYFFMVRLYGDVPYYTNAYNQEALGRTPMLTVLNNCITDLNAVKEDLPWTYSNPSLIGVRAMRGSAIALLMHLNMWAAGFDADANKPKYYTSVKNLGTEISQSTDYELLPYNSIEDIKKIFKGRTKESLFEIFQNFNNGEKLSSQSNIGSILSHYPLLGNAQTTTSTAWYDKKWMDKIYTDGDPDLRKDLWFENRGANNNTFQFKKYANAYVDGTTVKNDDDIIVFRLPDAYLLAAEANAELGDETEAKRLLNLVRARAGALDISSTGAELKDDIYHERVRELMGEGHYYYDLVRTKKVCDEKYCINPILVANFNVGAWTWPIDASALSNNPNMTLNNYWR